MVFSKALAVATALSAAAPLVSAFDAQAKTNVAVYYGQGYNQPRLRDFCSETSLDIINLGFINIFPDQDPLHWPGSNFGNQCNGETYTIGGAKTQLLSGCSQIAEDIPICQAAGKKVLLSLGGAYPATQKLLSTATANAFADFLWASFGPETEEWLAWDGPRPFGNATVDGFDFDIEHNGGFGYSTMVNRFREHYKEVPDRTFYISGAPQCPIPDAQLSDAIANSPFDFVWVQFYNTAGCSARDFVEKGTSPGFNYDQWVEVIKSSANPSAKLYVGLPASPFAAGSQYYLTPEEVQPLVAKYMDKYPETFGGIMLWEATESEVNQIDGGSYADSMKKILNSCAPVPTSTPTPSSTTSSSAIPSSTPVTTTTTTTPITTSTTPVIPTTTTSSTKTPSSHPVIPTTSTTIKTPSSHPVIPTTKTTSSSVPVIPTTTRTPSPSPSPSKSTSTSSHPTIPTSSTTTGKPTGEPTDKPTGSTTTSSGAPGQSGVTTSGITSAPATTTPPSTDEPTTITTVIVTSYTSICPTGFTTITTTYTTTYCPATQTATATQPPSGPGAVTSAPAPPEGWTTTVTVCTQCAATPTTVTLTVPCEQTTVPAVPTTVAPVKPSATATLPEGWTTTVTVCTECGPTPTTVTVTVPITVVPTIPSRPTGVEPVVPPVHTTTSRPLIWGTGGAPRPSSSTMYVKSSSSGHREPVAPTDVSPIFTGAAPRTVGVGHGMVVALVAVLGAFLL